MEPWAEWIQQLIAEQRLAALVVYGSPYLWQSLRGGLPDDLPAAWSPGQMPAAQQLVMEQIGLAPVSLEGGFTD
jgi:hypothetical protein